MNDLTFIEESALALLDDARLLYPCSGNDYRVPIRLLAPYVTKFWFVDRDYFTSETPGFVLGDLQCRAGTQRPALDNEDDYEFIERTISGPTMSPRRDGEIVPCRMRETYLHRPSGKTIKLIFRRGYGYTTLRKKIRSLGVFFYRGDSGGEGGSGNMWLKDPRHVKEVLAKMVDNGLLILDGSDGTKYRKHLSLEYSSFWKYQKHTFQSSSDVLSTCKPFVDNDGNHFTCVGHAGQRYGNTLIWQVKKL